MEGVTMIRKLLSKESKPPVEAVLRAGVLHRLVQLLAGGPGVDTKLQFEAAWAITNVASTEHTSAVVSAGAVPPLVAGMMSGDPELRDQCIWCLGNIAGDCASYRDGVINTPGALQAIMANVQQPNSLQLLRNATWTLSNLCRGKPTPSAAHAQAVVPALAYLITHTDKDVLADAAWGLSYLTDGEALMQTVLDAGVVPRCVELMGHPELTVVTPALRIIGNFISGNDRQTQAALDAGALAAITPLLSHANKTVRREACWAVSNVAAGTQAQLSALMTTPALMPAVVRLLSKGSEPACRKEAAWVVCNVATVGTQEHAAAVLALGVVRPLTDLLASTQDPRILSVVLDALKSLLDMGAANRLGAPGGGAGTLADAFEEAGLLDALESIQQYAQEEVYQKCVTIIETHFGFGDEEGAGADPAPVPEAPAFGGLTALNVAAGAGNALNFSGFALGGFGAPGACAPAGMGFPAAAQASPFNFSQVTFS
jgi:hypothetical protein